MGSILGGLAKSLRRWWQADRIRISSSHGRLRRLKAGDRVLLDRRIWQVVSSVLESREATEQSLFRAVLQNVDESDVVTQATLEVAIPMEGDIKVARATGTLALSSGDSISISDDDVTVLDASPVPADSTAAGGGSGDGSSSPA